MTVGRTGTPRRFDTPVVSLKSADRTITDLKRRRQYRLAAVIDQVVCIPRYDPAMASAADRAQVDLRNAPTGPRGHTRGDPKADRADGGGESHVELYENPRCVAESWALRRSFDDCPNAEGAWDCARAGAPDILAHVPAGALGRD
jgi:hypothetical protein